MRELLIFFPDCICTLFHTLPSTQTFYSPPAPFAFPALLLTLQDEKIKNPVLGPKSRKIVNFEGPFCAPRPLLLSTHFFPHRSSSPETSSRVGELLQLDFLRALCPKGFSFFFLFAIKNPF
eukprot:TRINITY_DN11947_c0_g1_i4.p1 TRINITY_DN11947_c0_g1~~TRINITY_DN11947_c0_g1_i4.p1  ORF type:complete len:121 (+),score=3.75 TRINITY_DN11947_c0_g1_i4:179-541(+)